MVAKPVDRTIATACSLAIAIVCIGISETADSAKMSLTRFAPDGRPTIASDISGKKICWTDGKFSMFFANGQYTDEKGTHDVWSVSEPGLIKIGNTYRNTYITPDGKIHHHWSNWDHFGAFCN